MKLPDNYVSGKGIRKPTAAGGLGEALLRRMGWSEGQGLGATQSGITEAIQVKFKDDLIGVGAKASNEQWENKWWEQAFNSAAEKNAKAGAADSDSDSDASSDDEFPGPAARRNTDGTVTTGTAAELRLAVALAAQSQPGRGKSLAGKAGKLDRIRRQEEASAAALAASRAATAASAAAPATAPAPARPAAGIPAKRGRDAAAGLGAVAAADGPAEGAPAKKAKKGTKSPAAAEGSDAERRPAAAAPSGRDDASEAGGTASEAAAAPAVKPWWGASRFRSVGCLEGLQQRAEKLVAQERQEFNEADQESLYLKANSRIDGRGKIGLGRGTSSGPIAGAKWEGAKKTFGGEDGAKTASTAAEEEEDQLPAAPDSDIAEDEVLAPLELPAIKWKKLITEALSKAAKKRLSLRELSSELLIAVRKKHSSHSGLLSKSLVKAAVLEKVQESSKFVLTGKQVSLVV